VQPASAHILRLLHRDWARRPWVGGVAPTSYEMFPDVPKDLMHDHDHGHGPHKHTHTHYHDDPHSHSEAVIRPTPRARRQMCNDNSVTPPSKRALWFDATGGARNEPAAHSRPSR
jgi:hypothetical protein